jgi:hypothetical protein
MQERRQHEFDPYQYGKLTATVDALEVEVQELRKDVKSLLELANKSRGGFWMGMVIASGIGGFVTYITQFFHK